MQHKWHKEIKAWADGAEIERLLIDGTWQKQGNPEWYDYEKYRIKPQPKEPQYFYLYYNNNTLNYEIDARNYLKNRYLRYIGKIKLENDDE